MCRAELEGIHSALKLIAELNFYKHKKKCARIVVPTRLFYIDNSMQGLHAIKTLKQHITNLEYITDPNISNLPKKSNRKVFRSHYEIWWRDLLGSSTRGTFFLKFKQNVHYEKYLDQLSQRNWRYSLSKIILSDHKLMIEQGRNTKPKTPRQERICVLCGDGTNSKIEDEVHFLFDCPWRTFVSQQERLIREIDKVVPFFKNLESHNKF